MAAAAAKAMALKIQMSLGNSGNASTNGLGALSSPTPAAPAPPVEEEIDPLGMKSLTSTRTSSYRLRCVPCIFTRSTCIYVCVYFSIDGYHWVPTYVEIGHPCHLLTPQTLS